MKIIELARQGLSYRTIAANVDIGKSQVERVVKAARESGELELIAESPPRATRIAGRRIARSPAGASPVPLIGKKYVDPPADLTPLKRLELLRAITDRMILQMSEASEVGEPLLPYKAKDIRDVIKAVEDLEASFETLKDELTVAVTSVIYNKLRALPDDVQTAISEVLNAGFGS